MHKSACVSFLYIFEVYKCDPSLGQFLEFIELYNTHGRVKGFLLIPLIPLVKEERNAIGKQSMGGCIIYDIY